MNERFLGMNQILVVKVRNLSSNLISNFPLALETSVF